MERNERQQKAFDLIREAKARAKRKYLRVNKFKQVPDMPDLYVTTTGKVYRFEAGKELNPTRTNKIILAGKQFDVAKLILNAFKKEPIQRKRHVKRIDGNSNNLTPENLKYIDRPEKGLKIEINGENLKSAIRCYFEVPRRYNVNDHILTRFYLNDIILKRRFYLEHAQAKGIEIFMQYMKGFTNSRARVAKELGLYESDCSNVINKFINLLAGEILRDKEAGFLSVKDFKPKPKTKTQIIREINEYRKENGQKPIPLRKKSLKEKLNEFQRLIKDIRDTNPE
ncbi:hypothetical protein [Paludibacter jiangxiensis]|uniref:Uncharacterized protein n=1 Tax=Paludibacter jiangxiensis TaxID=681398 RepID=A0A161LXP0_9BACT|nr:hypothetical protein [Paludibacter jiangxiensis]GAT64362.1 hypothetical protein PJIAN_4913 [Paludibacter jiangxiensis]